MVLLFDTAFGFIRIFIFIGAQITVCHFRGPFVAFLCLGLPKTKTILSEL